MKISTWILSNTYNSTSNLMFYLLVIRTRLIKASGVHKMAITVFAFFKLVFSLICRCTWVLNSSQHNHIVINMVSDETYQFKLQKLSNDFFNRKQVTVKKCFVLWIYFLQFLFRTLFCKYFVILLFYWVTCNILRRFISNMIWLRISKKH